MGYYYHSQQAQDSQKVIEATERINQAQTEAQKEAIKQEYDSRIQGRIALSVAPPQNYVSKNYSPSNVNVGEMTVKQAQEYNAKQKAEQEKVNKAIEEVTKSGKQYQSIGVYDISEGVQKPRLMAKLGEKELKPYNEAIDKQPITSKQQQAEYLLNKVGIPYSKDTAGVKFQGGTKAEPVFYTVKDNQVYGETKSRTAIFNPKLTEVMFRNIAYEKERKKLLGTTKKEEEKLGSVEQTAQELERFENKFYNSEGFQNIRKTANIITGGGGMSYASRNWLGKTAQTTAETFMSLPYGSAEMIMVGLPVRGALVVEALTKPEYRKSVFAEFGRAGKEVLTTTLNPTTPEGASTYITAGLFGSMSASAKLKFKAQTKAPTTSLWKQTAIVEGTEIGDTSYSLQGWGGITKARTEIPKFITLPPTTKIQPERFLKNEGVALVEKIDRYGNKYVSVESEYLKGQRTLEGKQITPQEIKIKAPSQYIKGETIVSSKPITNEAGTTIGYSTPVEVQKITVEAPLPKFTEKGVTPYKFKEIGKTIQSELIIKNQVILMDLANPKFKPIEVIAGQNLKWSGSQPYGKRGGRYTPVTGNYKLMTVQPEVLPQGRFYTAPESATILDKFGFNKPTIYRLERGMKAPKPIEFKPKETTKIDVKPPKPKKIIQVEPTTRPYVSGRQFLQLLDNQEVITQPLDIPEIIRGAYRVEKITGLGKPQIVGRIKEQTTLFERPRLIQKLKPSLMEERAINPILREEVRARLISITEPTQRLKPSLITGIKPILISQPVTRIKPEIKYGLKPEVMTETIPQIKTEVRTEIKPQLKPEVKTEVKTQIKTQLKPEVMTEIKPDIKPYIQPITTPRVTIGLKPQIKPKVTPNPEPITEEPPPPLEIPTGFKSIITDKEKKKRKVALFVRQKGKFRQAGLFSSVGQAITKGRDIISTTARASFKVEGSNKEIEPKARQLLNRNQFYQSRREAGVFIERREKRIKSRGELAEITYKGLMVQRLKRARF